MEIHRCCWLGILGLICVEGRAAGVWVRCPLHSLCQHIYRARLWAAGVRQGTVCFLQVKTEKRPSWSLKPPLLPLCPQLLPCGCPRACPAHCCLLLPQYTTLTTGLGPGTPWGPLYFVIMEREQSVVTGYRRPQVWAVFAPG